MLYKHLNDGGKIPVLGLGTYQLTGKEGVKSVRQGLDLGYRLLDTAAMYGNEAEVGKAIRESGINREEVLVTSKVWRDMLGYEGARRSCEQSLSRLNLDYLDLLLIHWPANAKNFSQWKKVNADTWRAFEELYAEGKVRSVGVSNFLPEHLDALLQEATIKPAVNQIEFHPGYWQEEAWRYCIDRDIAIEAWSPLAKGEVFGNAVLKEIAGKHEKSVAQICLRWVIQHEAVVIPKSSSPERMRENLGIFNFELTEADMQHIDNLPEMGFSGEHPNQWG